ncbi:MAG: hypothetical protein JSR18_01725 [Proteobacteria bacterium]|nr:hypothetical protein [Pseudomonadota bacterium]
MTTRRRTSQAARAVARITAAGALVLAVTAAPGARAADYRTTRESPTLMYDAPSAKARAQFIYGPDVPVEVVVEVDGWTKVRDVSGTIGWIANPALGDKRVVVVRAPLADVRANPDDAAPLVLKAEQGVLLEVAENATSHATTVSPGWVKVRHRDGGVGFVRLAQVFGF